MSTTPNYYIKTDFTPADLLVYPVPANLGDKGKGVSYKSPVSRIIKAFKTHAIM